MRDFDRDRIARLEARRPSFSKAVVERNANIVELDLKSAKLEAPLVELETQLGRTRELDKAALDGSARHAAAEADDRAVSHQMAAVTLRSAIAAIEKHGALLVYPIANKAEPLSLWRVFHPRTKMRWEWDESGDDRVVELWRMREQLARSRKVVYTKWFQNRATFFSRELFTAMLATYRASGNLLRGLDPDALEVLRALESDSPLGTKQLRATTGLSGRVFEASYARAVRELFQRMLVVGFGEVDEGAFPSLAIGATRTLFEDLWDASQALDAGEAARTIARHLPPGSPFARQHAKVFARLTSPMETASRA